MRRVKTIVALVDFSDVAPNVLKQVQTLAEAFKNHVTVSLTCIQSL
jgi:hypothetical protein